MRRVRSGPSRRQLAVGAVGVLASVVFAGLLPTPAIAEEPFPGMAGIDTSLPATDSKVTVKGRGRFAGLEITVNQTKNLTNQAISLTWEGGAPTVVKSPVRWFANFLQVMQCWGEPDGSVPENPGPAPENCVWGAAYATPGAVGVGDFGSGNVVSRVISHKANDDFDPNVGVIDEQTSGDVYRQFRAVDGKVVSDFINQERKQGEQYWLNSFFGVRTTNEIPASRTLADGTGQELFQVATGEESSGLGCGQRVEPVAGAERRVPKCWLVVVPRGEAEVENIGTPVSPKAGVATSPLATRAWQNRIAIPLEFRPVDSPCNLADELRQITGTEMALAAVASWQPVLCTQPGLSPYSYGVLPDSLARRQVVSGVTGAPGMVAVSRPFAEGETSPENPAVYAPLAVSAPVIAFNIERILTADTPDDRLAGVRFAQLNLTPRLVAKLLTQSYRSQTAIVEATPYKWAADNPVNLLVDPDFLQFNPEFRLWQPGAFKEPGGLLLPAGTSDLAMQVWEWILADPEAAAWLGGKADDWGMTVNPVYATTADANPSGTPFATPVPESFPKSDPHCYEAPPLEATGIVPTALCATDWFPYAGGLRETARLTRLAYDGSATLQNLFAATPSDAWDEGTPQTLGRRTILGLTDSASAAQYGVQMARLSRAGDDGVDRAFVAPDEAGMQQAVASMKTGDDGVRRWQAAEAGDGAYPLTTLTYGVLTPLLLDESARSEYAAFIEYAAGPGQEQGHELGKLPVGYLPLPPELRQEALVAAALVRSLTAAQEEPITPTTTVEAPASVESSATTASPSTAPRQVSTPTVTRRASFSSPTAPFRLVGDGAASGNGNGGGGDAPDQQSGSQGVTPFSALGATRFGLIAVAVVALLSALGVLEITKLPRRRLVDPGATDA